MNKIGIAIAAVAVVSFIAAFSMPSVAVVPHSGIMPASVNGTIPSGSLYSYVIGNTSQTDGFPAYEGPGSGQNQSMPQYIIIAINPVGNTSAKIMIGNTTEYIGSANSSNGPFLRSIFTNATGRQTITVEMHSQTVNQTVTDTYQVNFELVATFIHYEEKIHHVKTVSGISGVAYTAGGIFGILAVPLGFIHRSGVMIARFKRWFIDRWGH